MTGKISEAVHLGAMYAVIFFDTDEDKRAPFFHLMECLGLVGDGHQPFRLSKVCHAVICLYQEKAFDWQPQCLSTPALVSCAAQQMQARVNLFVLVSRKHICSSNNTCPHA